MVQGIESLTRGLLQGLNRSQQSQSNAMQQISSGKRINSAGDDAAGLALAERFSRQTSSLEQASRNASDGISLTQTGDGALSSITDGIHRIRELSLQAANGTLDDSDRNSLQLEVSQLQDEIQRTVDTTEFNGVKLFEGGSLDFQLGSGSDDQVGLQLPDLNTALTDIANIDISSASGARDALAVSDDALESITSGRVEFGAFENRLDSSINHLQSSILSSETSRSRIEDADIAASVSELIKSQTQQQAGLAMQAQANADATDVLRLLK